MTGSSAFPVEKANVQSAYADLSSHPVNSLCRPDEVLKIQLITPQYIQCFQLTLVASDVASAKVTSLNFLFKSCLMDLLGG